MEFSTFNVENSYRSMFRSGKQHVPPEGILDPDYVVNVSFRQLVLKNPGYSGKLIYFGRISFIDCKLLALKTTWKPT